MSEIYNREEYSKWKLKWMKEHPEEVKECYKEATKCIICKED